VELRHIRYFIAVAEQLNFSKAAQNLHMSQPPLSRQIHQLEEELGVQLLVRNKRRVELTRAGRVFLGEAKRLVVLAERASEAAQRAELEDARTFRVGIGAGLGRSAGGVVVEHHKLFPSIDIECKDIFSSLQNEALCRREIDVAFMRPPVDRVSLDCVVLFEERFVVLMPRTHRLAGNESVRFADIAEEPLILFNRGHSTGLHDKILGMYSSRGLTPHLTMTRAEAHEEAGAITVASGKGIFIGAGTILKVSETAYGRELAVARLDEPEAKIEVCMAWRQDETDPNILAFLDTACRCFQLPAHRRIA
jgi:DNA-binding transcriptional LysR family regulator